MLNENTTTKELIKLVEGKTVTFFSYYKYVFTYMRDEKDYKIKINFDVQDDPYRTNMEQSETWYYEEGDDIWYADETIYVTQKA